MKKYILLSGLCLLIAMLAATPGRAQIAIRDNVDQQLQRNEEMLATARALVRETSSVKARTILGSGESLQREARSTFLLAEENYRQGHELMARQMMKKAYDIAVSARDAIMRAVTVAKREAITEETAHKRLEQAVERHERARSLMYENSGPETATVRKLLEESRMQLERSRDNLREHMYDVALRLANLSISLSNRAINTLRRETGSGEMVRREIQKTQRLLEQIEGRGDLHAHAAIEKHLTEARRLQERATGNMNAQRLQAALELTRQARTHALRVLKMLSSRTNRENVEQAIVFTDGLIATAREMAGDDRQQGPMADALAVQKRAKESFARGEFESALRLTRQARSRVREMINDLDSPIDSGGVESTLRRTDTLIDQLKNDDRLSDNTTARELLQRAERHQTQAWDALDQSRPKAALAQTKLARNLANRALEQLRNENL